MVGAIRAACEGRGCDVSNDERIREKLERLRRKALAGDERAIESVSTVLAAVVLGPDMWERVAREAAARQALVDEIRSAPPSGGKFNVCSDCGSVPRWRWSSYGYCRACNEKNGYTAESRVPVDPDKLEALVGEWLTSRILRECGS